jgi:hypothetical protein
MNLTEVAGIAKVLHEWKLGVVLTFPLDAFEEEDAKEIRNALGYVQRALITKLAVVMAAHCSKFDMPRFVAMCEGVLTEGPPTGNGAHPQGARIVTACGACHGRRTVGGQPCPKCGEV